jgi:hypothetical protein
MSTSPETKILGVGGASTVTLEIDAAPAHPPVSGDEINGEIVNDGSNSASLEVGGNADNMEASLDNTLTVRLAMSASLPNTGKATDGSVAVPATETPVAALLSGMPDLKVNELLVKMRKDRNGIIGKSKALNIARYRMSGDIAAYHALVGGDEATIRKLIEAEGGTWPEANAKNPAVRALVQHYLFPLEDCSSLQPRISEWCRIVVTLLAQGLASANAAQRFLEGNGGVRGVYSTYGEDGHLRPVEQTAEVNPTVSTDDPGKTAEGAAESACRALIMVPTSQIGAVPAVVISSTLDMTEEIAKTKAELMVIEAEAEAAGKALDEASNEAEAAADEAKAAFASAVEEAERIAQEMAAIAEEAERRLEVLTRLKGVKVWGVGNFGPDFPPSTMGDDWAHSGVSCVLIHTSADGTFRVISNVTPSWDEFEGILDSALIEY